MCLPAACLIAATAAAPASAADPAPTLTVTVVQDGLQIPWDIAFLPEVASQIPAGTMLYTERSLKKLTMRFPNGTSRTILNAPAGMWASGETGLMSVEVDRDFATNRSFVTCNGYKSGSTQDVRVVRWRFNPDFTSASLEKNLITGLPSTSGRHGGCSLTKGSGQILYVGTGDAATGKNPQDLKSGGGKILRVDIATGAPWPGNPYITSIYPMKRNVATYGHRNVQGLARRADASIWSIEQGSSRDDEVNKYALGRNYGWNPVPRKKGDPSYNEGSNSPMTDYAIKGAQRGAVWRSGSSTVAASGGDFVYGSAWGAYENSLAVAALKDQSVRFFKISSSGTLISTWKPAVLDHNPAYGRLRDAVLGPDGSLYLTTSNGTDDKILKVTPVAPA